MNNLPAGALSPHLLLEGSVHSPLDQTLNLPRLLVHTLLYAVFHLFELNAVRVFQGNLCFDYVAEGKVLGCRLYPPRRKDPLCVQPCLIQESDCFIDLRIEGFQLG